MSIIKRWFLLAIITTTIVSVRTQPIPPTIFDTSSAILGDIDDTTRQQAPSQSNLARMPTQLASSRSAPAAPVQDASFGDGSRNFLMQLPMVRTDVVRSILSDRFSIESNFAFQQLLGPDERKALYDLAENHMKKPGATWLYAVVDEPQLDLTYKKQLYVAAPIPQYEWKEAVGLHIAPQSEHWLPFIFYKAIIDRSKWSRFRLAGIEVVREPEEAVRVLFSNDKRETLHDIAGHLGLAVNLI